MKRKVEASKDEPDAKKIKVDPAEEKQKEEMKKQNKRFDIILVKIFFYCLLRMFYYRDLMKKHMKKKELEALLEHNKQETRQAEEVWMKFMFQDPFENSRIKELQKSG